MKNCLICKKEIETWDEDICSDCLNFFKIKYGEENFRKKIEDYLDIIEQEEEKENTEEKDSHSIKFRRKKCRKKF